MENPFKDPSENPFHGTPHCPAMDEVNNSPFQQQQQQQHHQHQKHAISQGQLLPRGHVSNSSFSQHGTIGPQSQQHSVPGRQAIINPPLMPQLPSSATGQAMPQFAPQFAPQWSQPYRQLGPQSAPRAPVPLMSHPPWPQSSFQGSPPDPCQEPTQNFAQDVSGAQSSFYGPPPKEQYIAQKMLWDEPQDNFRLNRHDEQLSQNLSSEKRPSDSLDSSSLPKRQRFSGTDFEGTETMDNGNGKNSLQLSGLNNVEVMGSHNGDEALGFGNGHNPASDLRGQLLSRNYFVFYLTSTLIHYYRSCYAIALLSVTHYIKIILPTATFEDVISRYSTKVRMEMQDPAMEGKSFECRLRNRLLALTQDLGFDQGIAADFCQRLVVMFNNRPVYVDVLDEGLGFQPLIAHLYSLKKKVIFMTEPDGNVGDVMSKGHLDLLMADTINMVQVPIACKLARAPVYVRHLSGAYSPFMEDFLKAPALVSRSQQGDQVLKMVMEDLSCKEDDTVFVGNMHMSLDL